MPPQVVIVKLHVTPNAAASPHDLVSACSAAMQLLVRTAGDGCRLIKRDDERAFYFCTSAHAAIVLALASLVVCTRIRALMPRVDLAASVGIGRGGSDVTTLVFDDDYYGDAVNVASKLGEDVAKAGDVLVETCVFDGLAPERREALALSGVEAHGRSISVSGVNLSAYALVVPEENLSQCISSDVAVPDISSLLIDTAAVAMGFDQLMLRRVVSTTGADHAVIDRAVDALYTDHTVFNSDMSGFTRLTKKHGIRHFLRMIMQMRALVLPIFASHGGRVLHFDGDNVIGVFPCPQAGVDAAIAIQRTLVAHNATQDDDRRIWIKIGLAHGRVLDTGRQLLGPTWQLCEVLGEELARKRQVLMDASVFRAASLDAHRDLLEAIEEVSYPAEMHTDAGQSYVIATTKATMSAVDGTGRVDETPLAVPGGMVPHTTGATAEVVTSACDGGGKDTPEAVGNAVNAVAVAIDNAARTTTSAGASEPTTNTARANVVLASASENDALASSTPTPPPRGATGQTSTTGMGSATPPPRRRAATDTSPSTAGVGNDASPIGSKVRTVAGHANQSDGLTTTGTQGDAKPSGATMATATPSAPNNTRDRLQVSPAVPPVDSASPPPARVVGSGNEADSEYLGFAQAGATEQVVGDCGNTVGDCGNTVGDCGNTVGDCGDAAAVYHVDSVIAPTSSPKHTDQGAAGVEATEVPHAVFDGIVQDTTSSVPASTTTPHSRRRSLENVQCATPPPCSAPHPPQTQLLASSSKHRASTIHPASLGRNGVQSDAGHAVDESVGSSGEVTSNGAHLRRRRGSITEPTTTVGSEFARSDVQQQRQSVAMLLENAQLANFGNRICVPQPPHVRLDGHHKAGSLLT